MARRMEGGRKGNKGMERRISEREKGRDEERKENTDKRRKERERGR